MHRLLRARAPLTVALVLAGTAGSGRLASAQVLPETGGGRDITVRPALVPAAPPPSTAPAYRTSASIAVDQEWSSNAFPGGATAQPSFITVVTPGLNISADSARLTGSLNYAPNIYLYESVKGQNYVGQNLTAYGHSTLVPDALFMDVRGFAAQQALNSGTGPTGTTSLNKQNQVQTYSFSVTPYATHRFGDIGTAQIGAALSQTIQSTLTGQLPGLGSSNQNFGSVQETASFTTGDAFGRTQHSVQLLAAQQNGNGPLAGSSRGTASYQFAYAFTHSIAATASIGYENIIYGGTSPLHINDGTWSVGTRLTPTPESTITLQYGHQDGVTAAYLDASYAPTPRTRLYVRYSDGITTGLQQLQNSLASAVLDPMGNPVDATSGAPLQLTNNFFGTSTSVYQLRSASITFAWQLPRDSFQATINQQQQTPVGPQTVPTGTSTGTYGSLAWQHQLSEALSSNVFVQYGVDGLGTGASAGAAQQNTRSAVFSAGLTYALSDSLTGTAQYSYTNNSYGLAQAGQPTQAVNLFLIGLQKSF